MKLELTLEFDGHYWKAIIDHRGWCFCGVSGRSDGQLEAIRKALNNLRYKFPTDHLHTEELFQ
jgi:hypothetical protein